MCCRLLFAPYVVSCVFIVYTDKALAAQDLLDESLLQKRFNKNVTIKSTVNIQMDASVLCHVSCSYICDNLSFLLSFYLRHYWRYNMILL